MPSPLRSWWKLGLERFQRRAGARHHAGCSRGNCRCCRWSRPCIDRRRSSSRQPHSRLPSAPRRSASRAELDPPSRPRRVAQRGARRSTDRIEKIVVPNLDQAGRSIRLDHRRAGTDHAVAVQVLLETGFERFQRRAAARHHADGVREVVAAAVGVPDRILIGAGDLPGNLIAACRLLRADRRPGAELTRRHGRAAVAQRGARRSADRIQEIVVPNLNQAGRSLTPRSPS